MGSLKLLQWNKILLRPQFSAVDICVKAFCRASKLPSFTCNMDQSHFSTQLLTANSYWETQHCALARLYQSQLKQPSRLFFPFYLPTLQALEHHYSGSVMTSLKAEAFQKTVKPTPDK